MASWKKVIVSGSSGHLLNITASNNLIVSGGVEILGDLTVTGDDITMATNTSGYVLVADGTNYNPVAMSGDATIASNGAVTVATLNQSTTGTATGVTITNDSTAGTAFPIVFGNHLTSPTGIKSDTQQFTYTPENETMVIDTIDCENIDVNGTMEADAITVDGTTLATYIRDTVGTNMLSSNTETGITVTYDTSNDNIDFVVNVDTDEIAADAITGAKIENDAVDTEHIADDAIEEEHIGAGEVKTAAIADNAITLAKMAGGTDGQIITYDASGDPVVVGPGTDGQVLTSTGAGSPPAFEAIGTIAAATLASTVTVTDSTANTYFPLVFHKEDTPNTLVDSQFLEHNPSTKTLQFAGGDSGDIATIAVTADGGLNITTTDAAAAAANVQITADGTAELAGTTVTLDSAGYIDLNSDTGDAGIRYMDASTELLQIHNGSGIIIHSKVSDAAVTIKGNDGGSTIAALTFDMSAAGAATFNSTVTATGFDAENGNITNVGDIDTDTISVADAGVGLNIDFSGASTGTSALTIADDVAEALVIQQGGNDYLKIVTTNSSEALLLATGVSGTDITIGHATSEVTIGDNLTVGGDLTVTGTTTTVGTANLNVTDKFINLNNGAAASDGGIIIEGQGTALAWDEDKHRWALDFSGAAETDTTIASDAYVAAIIDIGVSHADDANYQRVGNIKIDSEEIFIYS